MPRNITFNEWREQIKKYADLIQKSFPLYTVHADSDSISVGFGSFGHTVTFDTRIQPQPMSHAPVIRSNHGAFNGPIGDAMVSLAAQQRLFQDMSTVHMLWHEWPAAIWLGGYCPCDYCGSTGESMGSTCKHCNGTGKR